MNEEHEDKILRIYEVGYHLVPTIEEAELESTVGEIRTLIEKASGSFIAEGTPTLMKLAYDMTAKEAGKRAEYDRGYFGWIKFEAVSSAADVVAKGLTVNARLLRSIVFQTVREDIRAKIKMPLREVRRTDVIRAAPRREAPATVGQVSEAELDKVIETLTLE
ncbi:hypothetical protein A2673_02045 [Candidatus Kaiserbacteria bacterium RIFCSPHIGHO2_01_FULL_50_13]|uniref:Small ribosomal subunit protein bS6 n=1 Tax=Candidatus Kaiserbacteria bacterium RIFCSPLOWO2_01_FULL_50_24 TaxID=1798507 RepID=A0A1F6ER16_9BACT|nr:MAG: hypothetical protein A2673_02045 [Candidatus Kaiserbacteria bacterium RIFCSPHIGHO2_01_FULL_50_13]OGG76066.1 MAG: hypothetical protein A3A34_00500 [Candidatus Kaiserbacteria bacterium RIFCSPLOWO2_01_FULL_50_24]OGG81695.1 MAG: hypothetical protein A3H74_02800 [Candidatus Kaiserbacteria bacterium RIFCSPLOWO2_02_FULL_51_13]